MPLDWLGQLKPSMQQQIALQRALLALQREDEQIRAEMAERQPALVRRLGPSPGAAIPGGPTYAARATEPSAPTLTAKPYFRPGAGSLEEALRAAQPSPEGVPTAQTAAWARREEILEERKDEAKYTYEQLIKLAPGRPQAILVEAVKKYRPEVLREMIRQGYLDENLNIAMPRQEATSVEYVTADNGEMIALTTYPDGRIEVEHTGV